MAEGINILAGRQTALNQTGSVVIKTGSGRIKKIIVNTAAASTTLNDTNLTGSAGAANLIFAIPNTVGIYDVDVQFFTGLVFIGSTSVATITFD